MGPIWGRQGPGGPHVGPMNFAIWVVIPKCRATCPGSISDLVYPQSMNIHISSNCGPHSQHSKLMSGLLRALWVTQSIYCGKSLLNWYELVRMVDLFYRFTQVNFIDMFFQCIWKLEPFGFENYWHLNRALLFPYMVIWKVPPNSRGFSGVLGMWPLEK